MLVTQEQGVDVGTFEGFGNGLIATRDIQVASKSCSFSHCLLLAFQQRLIVTGRRAPPVCAAEVDADHRVSAGQRDGRVGAHRPGQFLQ